jgi:hypothetical protein
MGTNRFREIYQGDDSLQLNLSSKDVIEIWSAITGSRCVQIRALRASPHPSSSFSNISIQSNTAMIIISAGDTITVMGFLPATIPFLFSDKCRSQLSEYWRILIESNSTQWKTKSENLQVSAKGLAPIREASSQLEWKETLVFYDMRLRAKKSL